MLLRLAGLAPQAPAHTHQQGSSRQAAASPRIVIALLTSRPPPPVQVLELQRQELAASKECAQGLRQQVESMLGDEARWTGLVASVVRRLQRCVGRVCVRAHAWGAAADPLACQAG